MLTNLNTHAVGYMGLAAGTAGILATVAAFFKLLSQPEVLVDLYHAISHIKHGQPVTDADVQAIAQVVGALVAILGAFVLAVLAAYVGRPKSVPSAPKG